MSKSTLEKTRLPLLPFELMTSWWPVALRWLRRKHTRNEDSLARVWVTWTRASQPNTVLKLTSLQERLVSFLKAVTSTVCLGKGVYEHPYETRACQQRAYSQTTNNMCVDPNRVIRSKLCNKRAKRDTPLNGRCVLRLTLTIWALVSITSEYIVSREPNKY